MVSWPAARMRRPSADRRSLYRKTANSIALQGFASSRAVSAMSSARRESCGPTPPGGVSAWLAAGGSGSSSDTTADGRDSSWLRAPASSPRRPASLVAVPSDASTSMRGGRGSSASRGVRVSRAGEAFIGPRHLFSFRGWLCSSLICLLRGLLWGSLVAWAGAPEATDCTPI